MIHRRSTLSAAAVAAIGGGAALFGVAAPQRAATTPRLFVDAASIGGGCSDARSPTEVSRSAPWCSIPRAIQAAPSGSTVTIRAGSYPRLVVAGDRSRTAFVTFRGAARESVSLAGMTLANSSYLAFERLTFNATPEAADGADHIALVSNSISPGGVNLRAGVHDVLIARNTIASPVGAAINFSATYSTPEIANITIRGNRILQAVADGMQLKRFRNVLIEHNEITGVKRVDPAQHSDVLQTVFGGSGLVFRNNHVHDNAAGILLKDGPTSGVVIENNLFVDNVGDGAGYAIQIWESAGPRIINNTVWNNTYGVVLRKGTTAATVKNNIMQSLQLLEDANLAYENFNLIGKGILVGRRDIRRAPRFASSRAGGYRLARRSPGIDAANSKGAKRTDRLGFQRVDDPQVANRGGGAVRYYDMGAHERRAPPRRGKRRE